MSLFSNNTPEKISSASSDVEKTRQTIFGLHKDGRQERGITNFDHERLKRRRRAIKKIA